MGNSHGKPVVFTDQVNLNHFRLLRVVGKGAFGKVRIVERKDTGSTFALKYIRKDEVVRSESVRNIIRERRMLEQLNHPFLCNLRYSFQDAEYLYLVLDLMTGGDLRFHISRKSFTEDAVRFWVSQLGCALRYIHGQGIVHRDVKPDNVLLDEDGHVHLMDFNVASEFKPEKPLTSKSGTLAYLAPEVYEGKGYTSEVDWWSLGVTFYECIYNKRPFEANNHDQLAHKIRNASVPFPLTNPPVSNPCIHAIGCLIERDRKYRIGAASFESFTDCAFFRTIDFAQLEAKKIDPIFIPSSEKTNFDATYDLEELLLEEAPLEARARRQRPRDQLKEDASKAEIRADELHRMIERLFEPFDYTLANYDKGPRSDRTESPSDSGPLPTDWPMNHAITPTTSGSRMAPHSSSQAGIAVPAKPAVENFSLPRPATTGSGGSGGKYAMAHPSDDTRSANDSPNGSPPLPVLDLPGKALPRSVPKDYFPDYKTGGEHGRSTSRTRSTSRGAGGRSQNNNNSSSSNKRSSPPKGVKPWVVEENQQGRPEMDALRLAADDKRPSGMLAFLSRKKGRDRSPKAKERGVLGKEGARQVVQP